MSSAVSRVKFLVLLLLLLALTISCHEVAVCRSSTDPFSKDDGNRCFLEDSAWRELEQRGYQTSWSCCEGTHLADVLRGLRVRFTLQQQMDAIVFSYPHFLHNAIDLVNPNLTVDWKRVDELAQFQRSLQTVRMLYASSSSAADHIVRELHETFEYVLRESLQQRQQVQEVSHCNCRSVSELVSTPPSPYIQFPHDSQRA